jgi:hypothetical protein
MSQQNCISCKFMRIAVQQDKGMSKYCCLHPPVAQCVPTPNGMIVLSVQAPVPPAEWCSKWEANPPALS